LLPLALDHASIADKDQLFYLKLLFDNLDLLGHRRWIATVPFEYANRQRFGGGIGQQTDNNLQLAFFAIAVIAELAKFVALALQIATGDIAFISIGMSVFLKFQSQIALTPPLGVVHTVVHNSGV
jgi:hypothetical protein